MMILSSKFRTSSTQTSNNPSLLSHTQTSKRSILPLLALPATCLTMGACSSQTEPKPTNVIVILADDLGYGDISCYGTSEVPTPNIDQLANEGVRFTDAHCVAATSTPSRYSLLTGMYAWRRNDTGVAPGDASMIIKPEQYSLADLFQDAGYTTAALGKWHLGLGDKRGSQDWNGQINPNLSDIGFNYSYIMAATADRVPCVYIENGRVANYDPEHPIAVNYKQNFEGEPTGKENPELLYNLKPSHGHDQSIVNGISRIGYMKGGGKALWKDENIADSITGKAIEFLEKHKKEPFFLYFCPNDVHVPRFPHERFRGKSGLGLRGDAIMQLDESVGTLIKKLEELGLKENTLIIFTSDNGPVLDDGYEDQAIELRGKHLEAGNMRGGKYSLYEAGTRVPFIVSFPKQMQQKASVSDALVSQIDLFASLASFIGQVIPDNAATDSQNFIETLLGTEKQGRSWLVEQGLANTLALREGKWKYIAPIEKPNPIAWQTGNETGQKKEVQLYDLEQSIFEKENLAEQYPQRIASMQIKLDSIINVRLQ